MGCLKKIKLIAILCFFAIILSSCDGIGGPNTTETKNPSNTETVKPNDTETTTPDNGGSGSSSGGGAGKPDNGDSGSSSGGGAGKPDNGDSGSPSGGGAGKPDNGDSGSSSGGGTNAPSNGETQKPGNTETEAPSNGESGSPSGGGTIPDNGETQEPDNTETDVPGGTETGKPDDATSVTPVDTGKITTYNEITACDAVENSKLGWNLGNTFDCYGNVIDPSKSYINSSSLSNYETAWGNPVTTQELIHYVKSLGFQGIRIPVTWGENLDSDDNIKSTWMARVKEVVEWALNEDLYVILNVHHDTGGKGWLRATDESYTKYSNRYKKIWEQIAAEFKDYSEKLMFEGYNEMLDGSLASAATENGAGNWDGSSDGYGWINKWGQLFVDTVRASGGNNATRNLICNTYAASSGTVQMKAFKLPTDTTQNHLIAEIHNYNVDVNKLDNDFLNAALFAERLGCPVIIGEWGSSTDNSGGESFSYLPNEKRAEHAKAYISKATKRGLACYVWDDGGSYKLIERKTLSLAHESIVNSIVSNVQTTVPLTEDEKNVTEINNFAYINYTIGKDLKFSWIVKPQITGDTSGNITYGIFSTDWRETYLWIEESCLNISDSLDLLSKISNKDDLPDVVYLQLNYMYGPNPKDRNKISIVGAKEVSLK